MTLFRTFKQVLLPICLCVLYLIYSSTESAEEMIEGLLAWGVGFAVILWALRKPTSFLLFLLAEFLLGLLGFIDSLLIGRSLLPGLDQFMGQGSGVMVSSALVGISVLAAITSRLVEQDKNDADTPKLLLGIFSCLGVIAWEGISYLAEYTFFLGGTHLTDFVIYFGLGLGLLAIANHIRTSAPLDTDRHRKPIQYTKLLAVLYLCRACLKPILDLARSGDIVPGRAGFVFFMLLGFTIAAVTLLWAIQVRGLFGNRVVLFVLAAGSRCLCYLDSLARDFGWYVVERSTVENILEAWSLADVVCYLFLLQAFVQIREWNREPTAIAFADRVYVPAPVEKSVNPNQVSDKVTLAVIGSLLLFIFLIFMMST